jgi:hypothetical protein
MEEDFSNLVKLRGGDIKFVVDHSNLGRLQRSLIVP